MAKKDKGKDKASKKSSKSGSDGKSDKGKGLLSKKKPCTGRLCVAAQHGDLDTIRAVLAKNPKSSEINAAYEDSRFGDTALHIAAYGGCSLIVSELLDAGADIGAVNDANSTPLHSAAVAGHLETVQFLIGRGASAEARNNAGWTPLMSAMHKGTYENQFVIDYLRSVTPVAPFEASALHDAAIAGDIKKLKKAAKKAKDIDAQGYATNLDGDLVGIVSPGYGRALIVPAVEGEMSGATAAAFAAVRGLEDVLESLVELGANIEQPCECGLSAGDISAARLHQELIEEVPKSSSDSFDTTTDEESGSGSSSSSSSIDYSSS